MQMPSSAQDATRRIACLVVVAATVLAISWAFGVRAAGAAGLASAGGRVAASSGARLTWGTPFTVDGNPGSSTGVQVSCSSPRFCAAVDGSGNASTFNGTRWARFRNVDDNVYGLSSVSCASRTFCFAADADGFGVRWNGTRWSAPALFDPDPTTPMTPAVSCPTSRFCAAVDGYGYALVWRQGSWTSTVISAGSIPLQFSSVSCVSASFCVAVASDNGDASTWNGTSWSKPRPADSRGLALSVSCVSSSFCAAVGDGATVMRGGSWAPAQPIEGGLQLVSVSCVSTSDCEAADSNGTVYRWNGSRWLPGRVVDSEHSLALSCRTTRFCAGTSDFGTAVFYAAVPAVTTSSLPPAHRGEHYRARVVAEWGRAPLRFSASGLPKGLHMATDGVISGTPEHTGHDRVAVTVSDPFREHSTRRLLLVVS